MSTICNQEKENEEVIVTANHLEDENLKMTISKFEDEEEELAKLSQDMTTFWSCKIVEAHLNKIEKEISKSNQLLYFQLLTITDFMCKLEKIFKNNYTSLENLNNFQTNLQTILTLLQTSITESQLPLPEIALQNRNLKITGLLTLYHTYCSPPNANQNPIANILSLKEAVSRTKASQKLKLEQQQKLTESLVQTTQKCVHLQICLKKTIAYQLNKLKAEKKVISELLSELLSQTEETINLEQKLELEKRLEKEWEENESPEAILSTTKWITFTEKEEDTKTKPKNKNKKSNFFTKLICHPKDLLREKLFGL